MSKRWVLASSEVRGVFDAEMKGHHAELLSADPEYRVLMVHPPVDKDGRPTGPAITLAKARVAAKVSLIEERMRTITGNENRMVDFLVEVDALAWDRMSVPTRHALADHELEHVRVQVDREGVTKRRDDGSARLELIPDDYMLNGFYAVVERWGADSIEAISLAMIREDGPQQLFEFAKPKPKSKSKKSEAA